MAGIRHLTYRFFVFVFSLVTRFGAFFKTILFSLVAYLKRRLKPLVDKDGLCIVANNLDTLNTVTEEVQQSYPWPIVQHLVTNQREIADLPTYQYAICCVRNAPRIISFNEHGELQPEADLGFRAFDKMERSTEPSGVIVILFNHPRSKDISELHCLEGITPSRLKDLAYNKRFLSVYRQFNKNQRERIKECFKVKP
uniref:Uncharacterized protein n=1 Tax=Branchiostoma floridae TaxID=7739 RepID=C3XPZ6_BRAFL|eukprot:XP_002614008.1 hypothetical protein BRAFLDRAFT_67408 [Branchiostoma floridae]